MLYWICPECGHECSPAIRECPTCAAPPDSTSNASQQLLSLAQNFQSAPSQGILMAPVSLATAVAVEDPPKEDLAVQEPEPITKLAPLDNLTVKPAISARRKPAKVSPVPVPVPISSPAIAVGAAPTREEFSLLAAGPLPARELSFRPATTGQAEAIPQLAEPLLPRRQSVAFVRAELPRADRAGMAFPDTVLRLEPVVPYRNGQPSAGLSPQLAHQPLPSEPSHPSLVPSALKATGESLADLLSALKISAEELEQAAIHAIQASFGEQPATSLLTAPAEIVAAPAPPAQFMRSQKPKFTAIAPGNIAHGAVLAPPQAPPLAGPSLPPQLLNFDHQNSSLRRNRSQHSWLISLLVATIVILGAVSLLQYLTQDRETKAASITAPSQAANKATPVPQAPVLQEHPAARSVEVAGVRIVMGPNKKPQLQYIVVNHSSAEITGLNIRIAVRSVDALAGPPLFSVSSVVAALGPNQSKEIRADLNSSIQPSAIPDWQSLRTEILIGRQ
jgi:hypothetical protein